MRNLRQSVEPDNRGIHTIIWDFDGYVIWINMKMYMYNIVAGTTRPCNSIFGENDLFIQTCKL